jgi:hypothetical protein
MAKSVSRLKMLVSCTAELQAERGLLERVVADVNRIIEDADDVTIRLIDWRRDVVPGVGSDAQQVINAQTQDYEIYLGMLGTRFGTPTPRAGSGTEDEFNIAYRRFRADPTSVRLLFYFRTGISGGVMDLDPEQLQRVQNFRDRLGREGGVLFSEFTAAEEFIQLTRDHLVQLIRGQWGDGAWKPILGLEAATESSEADLIAHQPAVASPENDEPGILDLRVSVDEAFEAATASVRQITELMSRGADSDRAWTARLQASTAAGVTPREAQAVINAKASDFGRRATALRTLRGALRASSEELFDALIQLLELRLGTGMSTADRVRADLATLLSADSVVRAARDTYLSGSASVASLPAPTRQFRTHKRNLMQEVELLAADIGYWLDRSAQLRSRFGVNE